VLKRRRWALLVVAAMLTVAAPANPVRAQPGDDCYELRYVVTGEDANGDPTYGWRYINVCENGGDNGNGGGSVVCGTDQVGELPCYDDVYGWWSTSFDCYVQLTDPPLPADDEAWEGNGPGDGAIYTLWCPMLIGGELSFRDEYVFLAQPPDVPSVADLARQAMESLPLVGASIGIAPDPGGVGLVGVPVWLWTEDTGTTWGPVSVSVPGPGITVMAEGNAVQIEWDMGDGTIVVCDGPGTPYQPSFGADEPDCGHTYQYPSSIQPDGRYTVTATTVWEVAWWVVGGGESGNETFERFSEPVSIQINELQVVTG
jgi:hypothetical protein